MSELCNTQPTHFSSYDGSLLLCPTIPSTDELPETRRGAVTPPGTQPIVVEWGFDPSVLIPKSVSPTTELWCFTHVSGGCVFQTAVGPARPAPHLWHLSRKRLQQTQMLPLLSQSPAAAHATLQENVSPPRPFSTPG